MENRQGESSDNGIIAHRLRAERKRLGLTQKQFAALGGVGLGAQHRYETGTSLPDTQYLLLIGEGGVDWFWVLSGRRAAGVLSPDQAELLAHFDALAQLDQLVLLRMAASLSGRTPASRPRMTEHEMEQSIAHFLRVTPPAGVAAFNEDLLAAPEISLPSTAALEDALSGFLEASPGLSRDELVRELAMSLPTILRAASNEIDEGQSDRLDTEPSHQAIGPVGHRVARPGRRS